MATLRCWGLGVPLKPVRSTRPCRAFPAPSAPSPSRNACWRLPVPQRYKRPGVLHRVAAHQGSSEQQLDDACSGAKPLNACSTASKHVVRLALLAGLFAGSLITNLVRNRAATSAIIPPYLPPVAHVVEAPPPAAPAVPQCSVSVESNGHGVHLEPPVLQQQQAIERLEDVEHYYKTSAVQKRSAWRTMVSIMKLPARIVDALVIEDAVIAGPRSSVGVAITGVAPTPLPAAQSASPATPTRSTRAQPASTSSMPAAVDAAAPVPGAQVALAGPATGVQLSNGMTRIIGSESEVVLPQQQQVPGSTDAAAERLQQLLDSGKLLTADVQRVLRSVSAGELQCNAHLLAELALAALSGIIALLMVGMIREAMGNHWHADTSTGEQTIGGQHTAAADTASQHVGAVTTTASHKAAQTMLPASPVSTPVGAPAPALVQQQLSSITQQDQVPSPVAVPAGEQLMDGSLCELLDVRMVEGKAAAPVIVEQGQQSGMEAAQQQADKAGRRGDKQLQSDAGEQQLQSHDGEQQQQQQAHDWRPSDDAELSAQVEQLCQQCQQCQANSDYVDVEDALTALTQLLRARVASLPGSRAFAAAEWAVLQVLGDLPGAVKFFGLGLSQWPMSVSGNEQAVSIGEDERQLVSLGLVLGYVQQWAPEATLSLVSVLGAALASSGMAPDRVLRVIEGMLLANVHTGSHPSWLMLSEVGMLAAQLLAGLPERELQRLDAAAAANLAWAATPPTRMGHARLALLQRVLLVSLAMDQPVTVEWYAKQPGPAQPATFDQLSACQLDDMWHTSAHTLLGGGCRVAQRVAASESLGCAGVDSLLDGDWLKAWQGEQQLLRAAAAVRQQQGGEGDERGTAQAAQEAGSCGSDGGGSEQLQGGDKDELDDDPCCHDELRYDEQQDNEHWAGPSSCTQQRGLAVAGCSATTEDSADDDSMDATTEDSADDDSMDDAEGMDDDWDSDSAYYWVEDALDSFAIGLGTADELLRGALRGCLRAWRPHDRPDTQDGKPDECLEPMWSAIASAVCDGSLPLDRHVHLIEALCAPNSRLHDGQLPGLARHFGACAALLTLRVPSEACAVQAVLSAGKEAQQGWAWALLAVAQPQELASLLGQLPPRQMVAALQLLSRALQCESQGLVPKAMVCAWLTQEWSAGMAAEMLAGVSDDALLDVLAGTMQQLQQEQQEWPLGGWQMVMVSAFQACSHAQCLRLLAALDDLHPSAAHRQAVRAWVAVQRSNGADDAALGASLAVLARQTDAGASDVWEHVITQPSVSNPVLFEALLALLADATDSSAAVDSSIPAGSSGAAGSSTAAADAPSQPEALFARCLAKAMAAAHRLGYPHIACGLASEVLVKVPPGRALLAAARELRRALPEAHRSLVLADVLAADEQPDAALAAAAAVACEVAPLRTWLEGVASGLQQRLTGEVVSSGLAELQDAQGLADAQKQLDLVWQVLVAFAPSLPSSERLPIATAAWYAGKRAAMCHPASEGLAQYAAISTWLCVTDAQPSVRARAMELAIASGGPPELQRGWAAALVQMVGPTELRRQLCMLLPYRQQEDPHGQRLWGVASATAAATALGLVCEQMLQPRQVALPQALADALAGAVGVAAEGEAADGVEKFSRSEGSVGRVAALLLELRKDFADDVWTVAVAHAFSVCTEEQSLQLLVQLCAANSPSNAAVVRSWVADQRRRGATDAALAALLARVARLADAGSWGAWEHVIVQRSVANAVLELALRGLLHDGLSARSAAGGDEAAVELTPQERLFVRALATAVGAAHRLGFHRVAQRLSQVLEEVKPGVLHRHAREALQAAVPGRASEPQQEVVDLLRELGQSNGDLGTTKADTTDTVLDSVVEEPLVADAAAPAAGEAAPTEAAAAQGAAEPAPALHAPEAAAANAASVADHGSIPLESQAASEPQHTSAADAAEPPSPGREPPAASNPAAADAPWPAAEAEGVPSEMSALLEQLVQDVGTLAIQLQMQLQEQLRLQQQMPSGAADATTREAARQLLLKAAAEHGCMEPAVSAGAHAWLLCVAARADALSIVLEVDQSAVNVDLTKVWHYVRVQEWLQQLLLHCGSAIGTPPVATVGELLPLLLGLQDSAAARAAQEQLLLLAAQQGRTRRIRAALRPVKLVQQMVGKLQASQEQRLGQQGVGGAAAGGTVVLPCMTANAEGAAAGAELELPLQTAKQQQAQVPAAQVPVSPAAADAAPPSAAARSPAAAALAALAEAEALMQQAAADSADGSSKAQADGSRVVGVVRGTGANAGQWVVHPKPPEPQSITPKLRIFRPLSWSSMAHEAHEAAHAAVAAVAAGADGAAAGIGAVAPVAAAEPVAAEPVPPEAAAVEPLPLEAVVAEPVPSEAAAVEPLPLEAVVAEPEAAKKAGTAGGTEQQQQQQQQQATQQEQAKQGQQEHEDVWGRFAKQQGFADLWRDMDAISHSYDAWSSAAAAVNSTAAEQGPWGWLFGSKAEESLWAVVEAARRHMEQEEEHEQWRRKLEEAAREARLWQDSLDELDSDDDDVEEEEEEQEEEEEDVEDFFASHDDVDDDGNDDDAEWGEGSDGDEEEDVWDSDSDDAFWPYNTRLD